MFEKGCKSEGFFNLRKAQVREDMTLVYRMMNDTADVNGCPCLPFLQYRSGGTFNKAERRK